MSSSAVLAAASRSRGRLIVPVVEAVAVRVPPRPAVENAQGDDITRTISQPTVLHPQPAETPAVPLPSRPQVSRRQSPSVSSTYQRNFRRALVMGRDIEKHLIATLDQTYSEVISGLQVFDDRVASVGRSSYPREMASSLSTFQDVITRCLTDLSLQLRTGVMEYEAFVRHMNRTPRSSSFRGATDEDSVVVHEELTGWEAIEAGVGNNGSLRDDASDSNPVTTTLGMDGAWDVPAEAPWSGDGEGRTRLELVATYLESLDDAWVQFEGGLERMCERLGAGASTRSRGVFKAAVVAGEAAAGTGAAVCLTRLLVAGPSPLAAGGFAMSVLSFLGLDRVRRELNRTAESLESLRDRTSVLSKKAKLVVEGYRAMAHGMLMETGAGQAMLDSYERRRESFMQELSALQRDAASL